MCSSALAAANSTVLSNAAYRVSMADDGTLLVLPHGARVATHFRPEFTVLVQRGALSMAGTKGREPVYNLTGWRVGGGAVVLDVFKSGDNVLLSKPAVVVSPNRIDWKFSAEPLDVAAAITLPEGGAEPVLQYTVTPKQRAFYSVAYSGAPAIPLQDVVELWQPLVWDGRRLPPESYLMPDDHCSIPGCLVETKQGTVGVMADPWQFPFEMPNGKNRRFGVTVRNVAGLAQPLVFTPFPGTADAKLEPGRSVTFVLKLVARPAPLNVTFEYVARTICGFRDQRENTLGTLNQTLDNIIEYTLGPSGNFAPTQRAFNYPDAKGTVKNVSALHPLALGIVTDNERMFREQGIPIMEYLMSREKFLFAMSEEVKTQAPSRKMAGPAMPVSELTALQRMTGGSSPVFLENAQRLHGKDRMLNMDWVSPGNSWQNDLWLYRATQEQSYLDSARRKADRYIAERVVRQPVDFKEVGTGTFFDYMTPWWKDLYELYRETKDGKYLQAAHAGARRYAQFIWFYPSVPNQTIRVNQSGFAPRRGSDLPGAVPAKPETVPAWRVSEQGLMAEGNGTAGHIGILLAVHAPYFMRLAHETHDPFLRDIARSAVIGRYANFPGYHVNTRYSTVQEKFDFPYHDHADLAKTTSFHFNHTLPMANLVLDYLMAEVYDRSHGAIDFPGEYAEGYAYLGSQVYGAPGCFHGIEQVWPWMPRALLVTDNVQVNYVAGRAGDTFCVALMNESDRSLSNVTVRLDGIRFAGGAKGTFPAEIWRDNQRQDKLVFVENGTFKVSLTPKGIVSLAVKGLKAVPAFQNKINPQAAPAGVTRHQRIKSPIGGDVEAIVFSFGPELTWLYAYQTGEPGPVKALALTVKTASGTQTLCDDSFPFEFTLPLSSTDIDVELSLEAQDVADRKERSEPVFLAVSPGGPRNKAPAAGK
jgi:hypothetical protein